MVEKLLALLLLLGCSPIIGSSHLQLQNKAINKREYCRSTLSTKAALSIYDADVEACTNLADITIYMTRWNEEDINRILSKIEYLYNVNLYIEDTTAVKIDLSSLKEMNLVYLVVSHNPTLKEISIPESAFTAVRRYKLLLYDNPSLDDETLAKFNKYCGNNCRNAKKRDVIVSEHRETMGRVNSSWCQFTTASPELSTYYKPDPEIINCLHFYRVKIYMTGWPVEDVELFTKKFLAASAVTIIVAHSEIEVLDLSALKFTEVFELILLDNLKLKEVRFSDVVMNTIRFRGATAIHSFNNPQLTNQSYETLVKVCLRKCDIEKPDFSATTIAPTPTPTEPPTTIAPTPPPTEPPTTIAPTPPPTEPPTTIAPTPPPTEPPTTIAPTPPPTEPPTTMAPTPPPTEPPTTIAPTPPPTEPPTTMAPTPPPTEPATAAVESAISMKNSVEGKEDVASPTESVEKLEEQLASTNETMNSAENELPTNSNGTIETENLTTMKLPANANSFTEATNPATEKLPVNPITEKLPANADGSTAAVNPTTEKVPANPTTEEMDYNDASNAILQLPVFLLAAFYL
ncbi:unnamed protein product [Caenorhabditis bovis]|uniref:Uncharacterized protein n=1 Tax=Caenorhabditis bovis TaxID=2654633 RepID=A0A8S1EA97_9PELO|nr:unnamed protein product [Caenorhabditis bovis]